HPDLTTGMGNSCTLLDLNTYELKRLITWQIHQRFIMYPHGISVNEEKGLMMVTSTIHPDLTTGMGNSCTLLDLNTYELKRLITWQIHQR
ncbi:hypothetical protein, partial [Chryseobacterium sp. CH1]|uniref:hypothetical protein n=1 Tax=Chryseobacterium sp. CH1 TaxID=713551 RepID=UPI001E389321